MDHDDACFGAKRDFSEWLKINNLHSYQAAFEEEGFDLASLCLLTEEDVEEFAISIRMKKGHKKKLPVVIQQLREEMQELKENLAREKAKRKREEARETLKQDRAEQLEDVEEEHKLAKARRARDLNADDPDSNPTTQDSTRLPVSTDQVGDMMIDTLKMPEDMRDNFSMPEDKDYFAFLSHKKNNTKLGNSTENLARSVSLVVKIIDIDFCLFQAKDYLEFRGYKSFFDVDNLHTVTMDALTEAVQRRSVLLIFLMLCISFRSMSCSHSRPLLSQLRNSAVLG
jgi:hypothetical protein